MEYDILNQEYEEEQIYLLQQNYKMKVEGKAHNQSCQNQ